MQLILGTTLQGGKYKIEKVLGQGGFGITYLAKDTFANRQVAIKEYFFKDYCDRDIDGMAVKANSSNSSETVNRYKLKFIKEAKMIMALSHPFVLKVFDIFEENNTAYYAMEYIDGESLEELIKSKGYLSDKEASVYIKQIAEALEYLHSKRINHLDVKPSNVLLKGVEIRLIDFGGAKQYDVSGGQTSTTPVGISQGYAPIEQYQNGGVSNFTPQSDIYSLGATLYKMLTGLTPPSAIEVFNEGLPPFPQHVTLQMQLPVKAAMKTKREDRPATISDFLSYLPALESDDEESTHILESQNEEEKHDYSTFMDEPQRKYTTREMTSLKLQANRGDAEKQYEYACAVSSQRTRAEYFKKAADQGHLRALVEFGKLLLKGEGMSVDIERAKGCFEKATSNPEALFYLGRIYEDPAYLNIDSAIDCFEKSLEKGYPCSDRLKRLRDNHSLFKMVLAGDKKLAIELGKIYRNNASDYQDIDIAYYWFGISSDEGNPEAMFLLASLYEKRRQYEKAKELYAKSAELNYAPAVEKVEKIDIKERFYLADSTQIIINQDNICWGFSSNEQILGYLQGSYSSSTIQVMQISEINKLEHVPLQHLCIFHTNKGIIKLNFRFRDEQKTDSDDDNVKFVDLFVLQSGMKLEKTIGLGSVNKVLVWVICLVTYVCALILLRIMFPVLRSFSYLGYVVFVIVWPITRWALTRSSKLIYVKI